MIASMFLTFVAFGVALAAMLYGVGGIFPFLIALSVLTVVLRFGGRQTDRQTDAS